MITKTGKQLITHDYMNYNVIYGTVDNKNPKSLYLTISAWGQPKQQPITNYTKALRNITKRLKMVLHNNLDSKLFQVNRTIVDFDMRVSGIEYGKRSYMNCEITLFQKNSFKLQEKIIKDNLDVMLNTIITDVLDNNIYFEFHKTKS